jgi:hypothetical protein
MDTHRFDDTAAFSMDRVTRRKALLGAGASSLAAAFLGVVGLGRRALAQDATPMAAPAGWRTAQVKVSFVPHDPVSVTVAGGGPPQRGDHFYIDAPIYAMGDENGAQLGTYQCFGVWTAAATDTAAQNQRLTTVHFILADGAIDGLINEAGTDPSAHIGDVQGGTGAYAGATGTFTQVIRQGTAVIPEESPAATPTAPPTVVDSTLDLLLPGQG